LYASYKDQIEFLIVYIREAHPEMLEEESVKGISDRPKDIDERVILATACVTKFKFTVPMVIDSIAGKVDEDYKAKPVRTTITDRDGKVAYYAGPGPFDFRLNVVERVLKKLVANDGYMPPPPKPAWGESVKGIRCGLSIDPPNPTIGKEVVAQIRFKNVTDKRIALYYESERADKGLVIKNDQGQVLVIEPVRGKFDWFRRRRRGRSLKRIEPGEFFESEIEGRIVAASESAASISGKFDAVFNFTVATDMLGDVDADMKSRVWTGQLSSGIYSLQTSPAQQETCISCHDKSDYHHKETRDCAICHIGEVDTEKFDINPKACSQCHPREGLYGRRQIAGEGGEFGMFSKHIPGTITDKNCLTCHDHSQHQDGAVILANPHSGLPWDETRVEFCLECHGDEVPDGTSFPAETTGSGYDKSEFAESVHARWLGCQGCSHCHNSHGSPYPSLLRADYIATAKDDIAGDGVFDSCWQCHQEGRIINEDNSFAKLHGMHVAGFRLHCLVCHDVHGGSNSDEPGSIRFRAGSHSGFDIEFIDGRNARTAFEIDSGRNEGTCYVDCHHDKGARKYLRGKKSHTVSCLGCH
jgi:hypothetical protein